MKLKVIPVILCGGVGTRLWPLSRELYPKQLLSLVNEHSLLQNTVARCRDHPDIDDPILICNEEHRFLVAEQLRQTNTTPSTIVLEPEGRNTAPAVALGAHVACCSDKDAILVVLPSDHLIRDSAAFLSALTDAIQLAEKGYMVTFGVAPDRPETGYGYIHRGIEIGKAYAVDSFVEKPDRETAEGYFQSGDYFWNSGMFVFRASVYTDELQKQRPEIAKAVEAACQKFNRDMNFTRIDEELFKSCPSESIDYAVMEGTSSAAMVMLDAGWSDIGAWDELWNVSEKDEDHNTLIGDVVISAVQNSYVRAGHRLVSVVGLKDVIVVETADAVLVGSLSEAQNVKSIVEQLKADRRDELTLHPKVYRPWGYYEGVDAGKHFQVKRISVNPGASLSLQLHRHRAEHWVVVNGVATVTRDNVTFTLKQNESTFIPVETEHRLQNLTEDPLEIIEVQSGEYLGEDDIVRLDDDYGRGPGI